MSLKSWLIKKWTGHTLMEWEVLDESIESQKEINKQLSEELSAWMDTTKDLERQLNNYKLSEKHYKEHKVKIVPEYLGCETLRTKIEMPDFFSKETENAILKELDNIAAKTLAVDLVKDFMTCRTELDPATMKQTRYYEVKVVKRD